ncbi:MAG: hypothetical protein ACRDYA_04980 [Egibacteraceae bacterium]
MSRDQLAVAARDRRWPKWSTMCLLRLLGLPVLNACRIQPGQPSAELHAGIACLAASIDASRLMLRSDGGLETREYYRGGNSFPIDGLEPRAAALLQAGRAVILLEPTNRFTNQLSVLLRMDRPGQGQLGRFVIEALGPGYDVGDLTRGGIPAHVTILIEGVDWSRYDKPWWADLQVTRNLAHDAQRRMRLQRLSVHVLADTEDLAPGDSVTAAEQWLRAHGHLDLWRPCDPTLTVLRRTRAWFEDAFAIAAAQPCDWRCLATSLSDLRCGRTVYWDVIDGARKYGIHPADITMNRTIA